MTCFLLGLSCLLIPPALIGVLLCCVPIEGHGTLGLLVLSAVLSGIKKAMAGEE